MKNILTFGASSSKSSINKQLATYTAHQLTDVNITVLDLNDFEMPIYSIDRENESGIPELAQQFKKHILDSDGIIISFAEHNGAYSAAFKNIFDWISRVESDVWHQKPMFLLSTAPGPHGGKTVLDIAFNKFSRMNENVITTFSLPSFGENFNAESGITHNELKSEFDSKLEKFNSSLK